MKILGLTEGNMMRYAAVREQVLHDRGLAKTQAKEETHNHLTLNFAPGMSEEQRKQAQTLYLSLLNQRPVEALPAPAKVIEVELEKAS